MRLATLVAATVLLSIIGWGSPVHADSDGYRWEHRVVCVEVGNGVDESWQVPRVIRLWNQKQDRIRLRVRDDCGGARQQVRLTTYTRDDDQGGWTQWRAWSCPFFERGIVHLNWGEYAGSNSCVKSSLAAHEIGHAMGLSHIQTRRPGTLMGELNGAYHYDQTRCGQPGSQDINQINRLFR